MKISLFLTVLILLATAVYYQSDQKDVVKIREEVSGLRGALLAEGFDPDAAARGEGVVAVVRLKDKEAAAAAGAERAKHETEVKVFAQELILFAIEMNESQKNRIAPDPEQQKRIMKIMSRFLELSESDLRLVISEVKGSTALVEKAKREMLGMSIMMLGQSNPAAGLQLFSESREFLGEGGGMAKQTAGMCLATWAEKDPSAAMAWMDKKENADLITDDTRRMALAGLARSNPALALQRLQSHPGDKENADSATASMIGSAAKPEDRVSLLAAAKAALDDPSLAKDSKEKQRALQIQQSILAGIGQSLGNGSFEESVAWMDHSGLSPDDRYEVTKRVAGSLWGKDPAPWLGWIGKEVTEPQKLKELTAQIVPSWTQSDFNSVGEWINSQEEGALRTEVTRSLASTLQEKEPEAAARWALTLPDSEERITLLQNIKEKWKTKDEAAAAAFAEENGL
ncbi:MAG: hypothetical protein JWM59_4079 [Verrucomicrobiales bacterium]|nr:hypothetical protein [Verrucomicrobiales bacterium]